MTAIVIDTITIRQDEEGRFCLNDLHKAAGGAEKDKPIKWMRSEAATSLISELEKGQICPISTQIGRSGGTFVCKELVTPTPCGSALSSTSR